MPTYDDITDAELDAESPLTESLFRKLRDNPEAIAEAAAGATRVRVLALDTAQDRADAGTGLAAAGMVPVATGGDGAEWAHPSVPGSYVILNTSGWHNVVAVSAGDSYKLDGIIYTEEIQPSSPFQTYIWAGSFSAIAGEDESGRWSIVVTHTIGGGLSAMQRTTGLVSGDTLLRVSGGNLQVNTGHLTGGLSLVQIGWFVSFVKVNG